MDWPTAVDGASATPDLIMATANKVDRHPPTPAAIADAWIANSCRTDDEDPRVIRSERYFFQNIASGIQTAEDEDIWRRMGIKRAPFLSRAEYDSAIDKLESRYGTIRDLQKNG